MVVLPFAVINLGYKPTKKKPRGCYRTGDCDRCTARNLVTWYWHERWTCDRCVLNNLLPEPTRMDDRSAAQPLVDSQAEKRISKGCRELVRLKPRNNYKG